MNDKDLKKLVGAGEIGKGIKRYNLPGRSHGDFMYNTGNTVSVVITLFGDRWLLYLPWQSFHNLYK